MNLNNHPHPYGIFIAGHDLGSDLHSELYCAAYGDGQIYRARVWTGAISDERPWGSERRCP